VNVWPAATELKEEGNGNGRRQMAENSSDARLFINLEYRELFTIDH
jgi:hypothetical protein